MAGESFGIEKESLEGLLRQAGHGELQLPEFQRGWVWPVENMISLLGSISMSYPVGTLMLMRAGGSGVKFKQRPLEGVTPKTGVTVDRLVLDGQQRLTSLYQALLYGQAVDTQDSRKRKVSGLFYVDIVKALDPAVDREEAIRFIPADRQVRNFRREVIEDYSTVELEYQHGLFPLLHVFDADDWEEGFQAYWDYNSDSIKQWQAFRKAFIKPFQQYHLPVIELGRDTPRQAVCQVFEKVNTGGVTLTVFELLTATFAADGYELRKDWDERRHVLAKPELRILAGLKETDFLQSITLLSSYTHRIDRQKSGMAEDDLPRIGCRRVDMLNLTLRIYEDHAPDVLSGLKGAAKFLHKQGFFDPKYLPYGGQIVPLAAIHAVLGKDAENQFVRERIEQWYWCGVLGELYGGATETRFARDLPEVVAWARGGEEVPRTVLDATFSPQRLTTLRSRQAAAYKGIYTLLLRAGASDWRTGDAMTAEHYFDEAVDIHHVFPKLWCDGEGLSWTVYDSIVNKTPLTARTNRAIGGAAPSIYRGRLAASAGVSEDRVDANVITHRIDLDALWADDFAGFMESRSRALLQIIAAAMGKPVIAELGDDGSATDDSEDELDDDN